ncbi:MAG: hypothetical protein ABI488_09910 [Polyangiaceae bacterium]
MRYFELRNALCALSIVFVGCSSSEHPLDENAGGAGGASGNGNSAGEQSRAGDSGVAGGSSGSSAGGSGATSGAGGSGASGAAGTSGAGPSELARPVTMNDVSILFPLGTSSDYAAGHLRADSPGSRGVLFPASVFQKVSIAGSASGTGIGGPMTAPYANMRVVSLRLDPCFAELLPTPTKSTCRNQLRLVFQELQASTTGVSAFDSGVHALYSITRSELLAIVNEIVRLREANGGQGKGPLGPHPLMVTQGLTGSFSTALQKLILQYVGEQNLVRATAMTNENAGFQWSFFGFDVSGANLTTAPITIATLTATASADATKETFFRGFQTSTDPVGSFIPKPTAPDDFTVLADAKTALALPVADQTKLKTGLARVDNPTLFTPDTVDCARCHTASPLGQNVARDRLHLSETDDEEAFQPDGHWVTTAEMKATDFSFGSATNPDIPAVNVHAFSYATKLPSVNQRTVNETAAVVRFLNDSFYRAQ